MRRIDVLIPPAKLDEIKEALSDVGIDSMTLGEVRVVDPANRRREVFRGSAYVVDFVLKLKMELVVQDDAVAGVLDVLRTALGIAEADEARVLLSEVVELVKVRGAEKHEGPTRLRRAELAHSSFSR
jgi:nitrogen regulatory protein P-II 1